jgi:coenzyme F420-reducing hydrogenase delta subunit
MNDSATVVVFACNWDGLSCIETAAQKRLSIPASVKIVRVSCLARVHTGLMLKALELGADGVMLLGCDSHNCHFGIEEKLIDQNYGKAWEAGKFKDEMMTLTIPQAKGDPKVLDIDEQYREDATIEKLSKLKPIYGCQAVTAGKRAGPERRGSSYSDHERRKSKETLFKGNIE